uniref:ADML protein n=1 Tax=Dromaius novaehollandiae TaxID=8790 RepID=A0A8C4JIY2_DRONO
MKVVHVALLYLGSVTFLGVDAARVDVATEFKRKWTKWALSRAKRDAKPSGALRGLGPAAAVQPLIRSQDVKEDPPVSHPRYLPALSGLGHLLGATASFRVPLFPGALLLFAMDFPSPRDRSCRGLRSALKAASRLPFPAHVSWREIAAPFTVKVKYK